MELGRFIVRLYFVVIFVLYIEDVNLLGVVFGSWWRESSIQGGEL